MSDSYSHLLWTTTEPYGVVVCKRKNWKLCPEHKHLTDKKPKLNAKAIQNIIDTIPDEVSLEAYEDSIVKGDDWESLDFNKEDLLLFGVAPERVEDIFNRKVNGEEPSEEQVKARVNFLLVEKRIDAGLDSLDNKKWDENATVTQRATFYNNSMHELKSSTQALQDALWNVRTLENSVQNDELPEFKVYNRHMMKTQPVINRLMVMLQSGDF
jgi:hypothetical protein